MGELRDRMVRDMDVRHFPALQRLAADVLLMAAYGGGLRVIEVVALRPGDLDGERGVIRVEQGSPAAAGGCRHRGCGPRPSPRRRCQPVVFIALRPPPGIQPP